MANGTIEVTDQLRLILERWKHSPPPEPPPAQPARYRVHREALYQQPPSIPLERPKAPDLIRACRAAARLPIVGVGSRGRRRAMTKTAADIFAILVNITARYGRCYPSIAYLADRADCSRRSAFYALRQLEDAGWIRRYPRRKPLRVGTSQDAQQDTNGYEVHHPKSALGPTLPTAETRVQNLHGKS